MQICLKKVRAGEVRTKLLDPKLTENMVGKYFWIPGIMVAWEVYFHLKVENLNNKTGDSTSCVQVDNNNKIKALIKIHPSIAMYCFDKDILLSFSYARSPLLSGESRTLQGGNILKYIFKKSSNQSDLKFLTCILILF